MSGQRPVAEIVADRMEVVMALTEANGAELRIRMEALGAEIAGNAGDVERRLTAAVARVEALETRLGALDEELGRADEKESRK